MTTFKNTTVSLYGLTVQFGSDCANQYHNGQFGGQYCYVPELPDWAYADLDKNEMYFSGFDGFLPIMKGLKLIKNLGVNEVLNRFYTRINTTPKHGLYEYHDGWYSPIDSHQEATYSTTVEYELGNITQKWVNGHQVEL